MQNQNLTDLNHFSQLKLTEREIQKAVLEKARVRKEKAREILDKWGYQHADIKMTNSLVQMGVAVRQGSKLILELSSNMTLFCTDEEFEDTVLHETAHFMAGIENGHTEIWKAVCRKIGANPERVCIGGTNFSGHMIKWITVCTSCGKITSRNFRKRRVVHRRISMCCNAPVEQKQVRQLC